MPRPPPSTSPAIPTVGPHPAATVHAVRRERVVDGAEAHARADRSRCRRGCRPRHRRDVDQHALGRRARRRSSDRRCAPRAAIRPRAPPRWPRRRPFFRAGARHRCLGCNSSNRPMTVIKRKATRREPLEEPSDRSAEASRSSGRRAFRPQASLSAATTFASGGNLENRFRERKRDADANPASCEENPRLKSRCQTQSTMERTEPQNPWLPPGSPAAPPPPYEEPRKSLGQRLMGPSWPPRRSLEVREGQALLLLRQAQAADDVGHDAGVGRRLHAALGLAVRGRLRGADLRPRDGPLHRDAPRGRQGPAWSSSRSSAPPSAPARSAARRSPRRAWASPARCSARWARSWSPASTS